MKTNGNQFLKCIEAGEIIRDLLAKEGIKADLGVKNATPINGDIPELLVFTDSEISNIEIPENFAFTISFQKASQKSHGIF